MDSTWVDPGHATCTLDHIYFPRSLSSKSSNRIDSSRWSTVFYLAFSRSFWKWRALECSSSVATLYQNSGMFLTSMLECWWPLEGTFFCQLTYHHVVIHSVIALLPTSLEKGRKLLKHRQLTSGMAIMNL